MEQYFQYGIKGDHDLSGDFCASKTHQNEFSVRFHNLGPTIYRNEGNVLFNDALNTFYLWLYWCWRYGWEPEKFTERKPTTATQWDTPFNNSKGSFK